MITAVHLAEVHSAFFGRVKLCKVRNIEKLQKAKLLIVSRLVRFPGVWPDQAGLNQCQGLKLLV